MSVIYKPTPKFYISDLRPWPEYVRIIKGHSGDVMEYVPAAEVDKLREQSERLFDKTLELATENAKLRELVRAMWGCISHIGEYDVFYYDMAEDGCGMSCTVNGEHCCADKLHDRMRELGVEVTE